MAIGTAFIFDVRLKADTPETTLAVLREMLHEERSKERFNEAVKKDAGALQFAIALEQTQRTNAPFQLLGGDYDGAVPDGAFDGIPRRRELTQPADYEGDYRLVAYSTTRLTVDQGLLLFDWLDSYLVHQDDDNTVAYAAIDNEGYWVYRYVPEFGTELDWVEEDYGFQALPSTIPA